MQLHVNAPVSYNTPLYLAFFQDRVSAVLHKFDDLPITIATRQYSGFSPGILFQSPRIGLIAI